MRKILLAAFLLAGISQWGVAQQDPMYTKYMFNSLVYNPAFAGSPEYLSVRALYRNQWWGLEGGPNTQSFSIHAPLKERIGVGLSVVNDELGPTGTTNASLIYAYRIPFGNGKISLGLQASVINWRADWSLLKFKDPRLGDAAFEELEPSRWMVNFGAGAFYYTQKYYVGVSVPHLMNNDLRVEGQPDGQRWAQTFRHYFIAAGAAWPIKGPDIYFKPSLLIKSVGIFNEFGSSSTQLNKIGAPTEFDIDAGFLFYEVLWVGASFRSAFAARQFGGESSFDSVDFWASYYLQNGIRIGASYDYTLTKLQKFVDGSFEIMLGYDMNYNGKKILTPRYF